MRLGMEAERQGSSRWLVVLLPFGVAGFAVALASGCAGKAIESSEGGVSDDGPVTGTDAPTDGPADSAMPEGSTPDTGPPPCVANTYIIVAAVDCPDTTCPSGIAYALCNGATYSDCDCLVPSGYTEADGG